MEKSFEYYLEMARGPLVKEKKLSDEKAVEKALDKRLGEVDTSTAQHAFTIHINELDYHDLIRNDRLEEIMKKLIPKYEKAGWKHIEFEYPIITFRK